MTHVPYKGAADAQRDLIGDMVDIFITPYGAAQVELVKQGKIKAIAVLTQGRQRLLPEVPSTAESKALKGFTAEIGTGYFVKRDTPAAVVQTLAEADAAYKAEIALYQRIARSIHLTTQ